MVENYTLLKLLPQTITEHFDSFVDLLELSAAPIRSISSINYLNSEGNSQGLSETVYKVLDYSLLPKITRRANMSWPTTSNERAAITVVYTVGFDDASAVPSVLKSAMLLLIGYWYENRQDSVRRMPTQVEWMLRPYRVMI